LLQVRTSAEKITDYTDAAWGAVPVPKLQLRGTLDECTAGI